MISVKCADLFIVDLLIKNILVKIVFIVFCFLFLNAQIFAQTKPGNASAKNDKIQKELDSLTTELKTLTSGNNWKQKSKLLTDIGHINDFLGRYDQALMYYYQALSLRDQGENMNYPFGYSNTWGLVDIGNVFYKMSSYKKAIEIYRHAFGLFFSRQDTDGMITTLNNIGESNIQLNNSEKALSCFKTSQAIAIIYKNPYIVALTNVYIGSALVNLKKYSQAIFHYESAIDYFTEIKDTINLSFSLRNLSDAYKHDNKQDLSLECCRKIKSLLYEKMQNPIFGHAVATEAEILFENGYDAHALDTVERYIISNNDFIVLNVLAITVNYDSVNNSAAGKVLVLDNTARMKLYNVAYKCNKISGNTREALYYYEKYAELRDSVQRASMNTIIWNQDFSIRSSRLFDRVELLEEKGIRLQSDRNYVRNLSYYLLFAALLMLIVVVSNRKRFSYRYRMLHEYIEGLADIHRFQMSVFLGIYCILFFWFFKPALQGNEPLINISFIHNLIPGLLVFFAVFFSFTLMSRISASRLKIKPGVDNTAYLSFSMAFILSYALQIIHYTVLSNGLPSQGYMFSVALLLLAAFILPFNIFIIFIENFVLKKILENATEMSKELKEVKPAEKGVEKVTFRSLRTSDSLVVDPANLLGVEAQGNYCRFYYLDDDVVKQSMVLIAIKRAEAILEGNDRFMRCHNSYIVNIDYVVKVSGNSRGYQLKMLNTDEIFYVSRARQSYLMERIKHLTSIK